MPTETHPEGAWPRVLRALRPLDAFRGWRRVARTTSSGEYEVDNGGLRFAGTLGSMIEREVYLFGGYERLKIDGFLSVIRPDRRRCFLDVGANIGTHTLAMSKVFAEVNSFEPNPEILPRLSRNVSLNDAAHVHVHPVGLSDADAVLPFYNTSLGNRGMGTFSTEEQYDVPVEEVAQLTVRQGDGFMAEHGINNVDAVKIDVQGFEPQVIAGLQGTLDRDRPVVWLEVGPDSFAAGQTTDDLRAAFPYPLGIRRMRISGFRHRLLLDPVEGDLPPGDYVLEPGS